MGGKFLTSGNIDRAPHGGPGLQLRDPHWGLLERAPNPPESNTKGQHGSVSPRHLRK